MQRRRHLAMQQGLALDRLHRIDGLGQGCRGALDIAGVAGVAAQLRAVVRGATEDRLRVEGAAGCGLQVAQQAECHVAARIGGGLEFALEPAGLRLILAGQAHHAALGVHHGGVRAAQLGLQALHQLGGGLQVLGCLQPVGVALLRLRLQLGQQLAPPGLQGFVFPRQDGHGLRRAGHRAQRVLGFRGQAAGHLAQQRGHGGG